MIDTWKKLADIAKYIQRGKSPKYSEQSEMIVINQKCIRWNRLDLSYARYISTDQILDWKSDRILKEGDLLWNSTGTGTIGRACLFFSNDASKKYVVDSHITIIRASNELLPKYLLYWIFSPSIQNNFERFQSGSTNQVELSKKTIEEMLIPIVSLEEQCEIVKKLDVLLYEIDASIAEINILKRQFELYKQSVLNAAIRGQLVPQELNDEPASVLLGKIKAARDILVKEGKLKKIDSMPVVDLNDVPFELPQSWEWTTLQNLGLINPRNSIDDNTPVSFIPMSIIPKNFNTITKKETRLWKEVKLGFTHLAENDLVVAKITPCFENGKSTVMSGLNNSYGAGTTELHIFRDITGLLEPNYLLLFLKSAHFIINGKNVMTGSAGQKRVPREYFASTPIPLPPIKEQKRIVEKATHLIQNTEIQIENLELLIQNAQTLRQSILKQAFEGKLV